MGALIRAEKSTALQADEENHEQGLQYLTFLVSEELFAIDISDIKEIIEYIAPTTVPMMPDYLRGVINLRGRAVPVIDLTKRFEREGVEVTRRTCIVILEFHFNDELRRMGILVDAVKAVIDIANKDIEPAPSFGSRLNSDFISGMGKVDDGFVIVLDIEQVLSMDELSMLNELDSSSSSQLGLEKDTPKLEQSSEVESP